MASQPRGGPGYKIYAAEFTQTGVWDSETDQAPVATVKTNTLGGTVVWSQTAAGVYTGTLTGAFLAGKVPRITGLSLSAPPFANFFLERTDNNKVTLRTFTSLGSLADELLDATFIEIRVYP